MNRNEAIKIDKGSCYIDEEDDNWYIFGTESGFSYSSWLSEEQAETALDKMNT